LIRVPPAAGRPRVRGLRPARGGQFNAKDFRDVTDEQRVYIGGLPFDTSVGDLTALAGQYVSVTNVRLPIDATGRIRGFGFVTVASADHVADLVKALDGRTFRGRRLRAAEAVPRGY